uniref:Sulfotransferase domain-containing protein n=1 Tax=Ditylenchus dipsaci TaxID=166011 RepID=A0A915E315_9BILA
MSLDCLMKLSDLQDEYFFRLPHAKIIADYVWPGVIMGPQRVIDIKDIEFGADDIVIASYPKSGTTGWLSWSLEWRLEVILKLSRRFRRRACSLKRQRSVVCLPSLIFLWVAAQVCAPGQVPIDLCCSQSKEDNAVSFYHFHRMSRFLGRQKNLSWNDFFALYLNGTLYCGSWFEHVLGYWKFAKGNDKVLFVKYEDLKQGLNSEVDKIATKFLDFKLDDVQMAKVLQHTAFDSMKDNKMANRDFWLSIRRFPSSCARVRYR